MNTSTDTNQTHDTTTNTPRATAIGFRRRTMAGALLVMGITATAVGLAGPSHADAGDLTPGFGSPPTANCQTDRWGFLGSQRRTLCDGPVSADGSWTRQRTIWSPPRFTSTFCPSRGSGYSSTYCSGGYYVDQRLISSDTYPVRPDTVLPDEPGHLG